jgi:hypothetical protein
LEDIILDAQGVAETVEKCNVLTGSHKKTAHALVANIVDLAKRFGLERLGFLTFTTRDNCREIKEAQRRFNSLNTHFLRGRYERVVAVLERQRRGAWHFHCLIVLGADIRTGFVFEDLKSKKGKARYRSASAFLREEWAVLRRTCPRFGFCRHELLPVRSTAKGIAYYVGGYISKHVRARNDTDKRARLVRYIGFKPGDKVATSRFMFVTMRTWLWRHKLKAWATRNGLTCPDQIAKIFGPRWCYHLQEQILREPVLECFPSAAACSESRAMEKPEQTQRVQDLLSPPPVMAPQPGRVYQMRKDLVYKPLTQLVASD